MNVAEESNSATPDSGDDEAWREFKLTVTLSPEGATDDASQERFLAPLTRACLTVSPGGFLLEGANAPPGDDPSPEPGTVRLRVYALESEAEAAAAQLHAALTAYPGSELRSLPLDPEWRERWKRWFHGFTVSDRLSVRPTWEAPPAGGAQDRVDVVIEPGMAFGTGQHETTFLCLQLVDELCLGGAAPHALLDVGCGTGILAIAAALLGVPKVVGIDVDATAVGCAIENVEANGVLDRVHLSTTPIGAVTGQYPVVVANIMAHILESMADALVARVAPGGLLVLSGVLAEQVDGVCATFARAGVVETGRVQRGEWMRLHLQPAPR